MNDTAKNASEIGENFNTPLPEPEPAPPSHPLLDGIVVALEAFDRQAEEKYPDISTHIKALINTVKVRAAS